MSLSFLSLSLGGVIGCTGAAIVMERFHPRYAFLTYSCLGFMLAIACCFLSADAERERIDDLTDVLESEWSSELKVGQTPSEAQAERLAIEESRAAEAGLWMNFKQSLRLIGRSLTRPEIYRVVIFFILEGLTKPSFADYTYFFLMNTIGVSKFMFAIITLVGQICGVVGVIIYERVLKTREVRTVLAINVCITILGAFLAFVFAKRWNLEFSCSDYVFLFLTDVVFAATAMAFSTLPIMALFAKITPPRIEGTMFAFLTGTSNLDLMVLQPLMGNFVNLFVGVNKDDLSGYSTLILVQLCCSPIGFLLIYLIPLKDEIDESQKQQIIDEQAAAE